MRFFDFFKIIYDVVFAVQLLAVSFSVVWIFYPWNKERKNILIGVIHIVCVFAVGTVLNWLLFALSSVWRGVAGIHFYTAWLLTILFYLGLFDRSYMAGRLIMGATLFITVVATSEFGRDLMRVLQRSFPDVWFDFTCFFADLMMVLFSFAIRRFSIKNYSEIPLVSVIMIMINTLTSTVLIVTRTLLYMNGTSVDWYYCCILAGIYIFSVTGYFMISYHCKERKEKIALEVQNKLLETDKQMLIVSEQAIEEMRFLKHDMKNQLKVMSIMLEEGKYDELKDYFSSMTQKFGHANLSEFIDCGNHLVNSIVNMEMLKALSYGVKLVTKINVPTELPFEASDLCRIIVNLLDNAIEEILRTKSRNYLVDMKIGKRGDCLYICVQNEIRDDADRKSLLQMNTVKDDAVNHGYGHRIVKRIVEKYNGYVNYAVVENEFVAEVMLDLVYTEK